MEGYMVQCENNHGMAHPFTAEQTSPARLLRGGAHCKLFVQMLASLQNLGRFVKAIFQYPSSPVPQKKGKTPSHKPLHPRL